MSYWNNINSCKYANFAETSWFHGRRRFFYSTPTGTKQYIIGIMKSRAASVVLWLSKYLLTYNYRVIIPRMNGSSMDKRKTTWCTTSLRLFYDYFIHKKEETNVREEISISFDSLSIKRRRRRRIDIILKCLSGFVYIVGGQKNTRLLSFRSRSSII